MRIAAVGLLSLGWLAVAGPDNSRLDVVVRDGHGRIVRDLEAPDIAVFENGGSVAVRSVRAADPKQRRLLCLLFDRMSGEAANLSREAALELVKAAMKSNVAIAVIAAEPKLEIRQFFTSDQKSLRSAIESLTGGKRAPDARGSEEFSSLRQRIARANAAIERETRTRPSVVALLSIARGLSAEPGRKAVVYFSAGLPIDPRQDGFREILSAANRASVAVYTVDAAGLAISRDEEARRVVALQSVMRTSGDQTPVRDVPGGGPPNIYTQSPTGANRVDSRAETRAPVSALAALAQGTGGFLINESSSFRTPIRRVPEELASYYEVEYGPGDAMPDGGFRATRVTAREGKLAVQGRAGYFATPDLSGRPALPFELALLKAIGKSPAPHDFPHRTAVLRFRTADGSSPAPAIVLELPAGEVEFQRDDAAGLFRAHISMLALIRDASGTIVDRFSSETPLLSPPGMLDEMRKRDLALGRQIELPPGKYMLETAVQDHIAGRFSTNQEEFVVAPVEPRLALSSISVARSVTPTPGAEQDGAFHLENKTVQPALDGVVGGADAAATVYFRLYPAAGNSSPVDLTLELMKGAARVAHSGLQVKAGNQRAIAEVLTLDLGKLGPGSYDLRVVAAQGEERAEEQARLTIAGTSAGEVAVTDAEVHVQTAAEPSATPPTAEQQKLLEAARESALQYSDKLPNFICTQSTRHILDPTGKGAWRTVEEASDLLSFYDGREHYASLTSRTRSKEGEWPASVTSAGEFGSLLKQIFDPASAARFAWLRSAQLRGRQLQVFTFAVDAAHSKYRVTYRSARPLPAFFPAFKGEVWVDPQTATVQHLTFATESLPAENPIRQISLVLDYDDVGVADKIYLLPIAVSIDVRLHKSTVARNEVTFRSYQRFSSDSRVRYQ